ncbi:MAG: PEP-utilizing enzyme [Candidatus Woesearchaeota archaeon]
MIKYLPQVSVLFVEDDEKVRKALTNILIKNGVYVHSVDNLQDAINVLRHCKVDILVSDGVFPKRTGLPATRNFPLLVDFLKSSSTEIIAWSNSTYVHEYCKKHRIKSYSKILLTRERFRQKGREYIKVRTLAADDIVELIKQRLLARTRLVKLISDSCFEVYVKDPITILGAFLSMDARTTRFKETAGINYGPAISEMNNGIVKALIDTKNDERIADRILSMILREDFFPVIKKEVNKRASRLLDFSRRLRQLTLHNHSNKELAQLYMKFCILLMDMRVYSSLPTAMEHRVNLWSKHLKDILRSKVKDKEELNKLLSLLTTPENLSYVREFERKLVLLGKEKLLGKDISRKVDSIAKDYAWINYSFEGTPIDGKFVRAKITSLCSTLSQCNSLLKEFDEYGKEITQRKALAKKTYGLTDDKIAKVNIGADIVFLKFFRKGVFAESYYSVEFLLKEIGKRIGASTQHVANMLPQEVLAALFLGRFPKELVDYRIKSGVLFHSKDGSVAFGSWLKPFYKHRIVRTVESTSLQGQTAFPGLVKGKVRIVNIAADMKGFSKGDILVSRSTNPSLIPVMHKCAAIVTDIGGLTCHAAIVARELKKPCVVGTKNATKVLKDGDFVEVDANKAIVIILKKNEKNAKFR